MTSHDALIEYSDNYIVGRDAMTDFVAPVRRPVGIKECLWEFLRMRPIQEAPAKSVIHSVYRASASAQTNLETTTLDANVFTDTERILFEFPRTGFLDPLSIQMAFNLRCVLTTDTDPQYEWFNYDITTMFTRIRLLYNDHEIEDVQRADLLAHIQSSLFDSPQLQMSGISFLRGKHPMGNGDNPDTWGGDDATRRMFYRRSYHSPHNSSTNSQPYGQTRRYMIPLPLGLFRQKKPIPLHLLNGNLRVELTVARFADVHASGTRGNASAPVIPQVGRIEIGMPLLHAKVFKQGLGDVDRIFNEMLGSGRLVYGFQSFQYDQFPIRVPANLAEIQSFQKTQVYTIKANLKYARYLVAGVTIAQPTPSIATSSARPVDVSSTHLHNSWFNVQVKNASFFHQTQQIRKKSQLYSFQLTYDGKPVTPEIKCSTNPCKYWRSTTSSVNLLADNPDADDVSNNVVEPFYYYNQAVPSSCGRPVLGRNNNDFVQGMMDTLGSNVHPGVRNDIYGDLGPAPLIMVIPLSTVLPNGDIAALSLGSGNETLTLTLKWNSPDVDVMTAAVTDANPTPFPPPIQLNTSICYDRLMSLNADSSVVFEE